MARTARSELALGVGGPGARGGVCLQTAARNRSSQRSGAQEEPRGKQLGCRGPRGPEQAGTT